MTIRHVNERQPDETRPLTLAMRRGLVLLSGREPATSGPMWLHDSTYRALISRGLARFKGTSWTDGVELTDEGEREAAAINPDEV